MSDYENSQLTEVRQAIDKLDITIWSLLEKRFVLAKEMARIKNTFNLPVLDEKREQDVLAKIATLSCDSKVSSAIASLYKLLFELSRKYQGE